MANLNEDEDLSWLDEHVRGAAEEMLQVLFSTSRIGLVVFDAHGAIRGLNPHASPFNGVDATRYDGVSLLEHSLFARMGVADLIRRVLKGEKVELTDSRWITLFSGEERYVDIVAGPITVAEKIFGGVAFLVDATDKHRATLAETKQRKRTRELEVFLARDVAKLVSALDAWSRAQPPTREQAELATSTVAELSALLDDLLQFIQLGTYKPKLERLLIRGALENVRIKERSSLLLTAEAKETAVIGDQRLLRRVLQNLLLFTMRMHGGQWTVEAGQGRVIVRLTCDASPALLQELLIANALSTAESSSADTSLAAARWMTEMMNGTLTATEAPSGLALNLPLADSELLPDVDLPQ